MSGVMRGAAGREVLARAEPLTIGLSAPLFAGVAGGLAVLAAAADAVTVGLPPGGTIGALALLLAAGAVLVAGARPAAAPFRARTHALVLVLLTAGLAVDAALWPPADRELLGGPVLVVVLLFQLALALLRPPLDVLLGGLVVAGVLVVVATAPGDPASLPSRAAAVTAAALAPTLAAAALGRTALRRLRPAPVATAEVPADSLRLSVQQEAVARLEAEAVPLIDGVLARQALTPADAARAGEIAQALRSALLADLARGWLADAGVATVDPRGYAERMTARQRTAVRTALAALPLVDPEHPGSARLTGQDGDAELVLELPLAALPDRRRVSSLIPLLRAAFASADLRIDADRAVLTATFTASH